MTFIDGEIREQRGSIEEGGNGSYGDRLGGGGRVGTSVVLGSTAEGDGL